ncbi:hypothetical protein OWV82_010657 [Melia azedarach]|uniref:Uncharacterized protein n=1 Tax=Melia azedarach TaxID=155640 RepID=A0ACC1Y5Q7_MELAZ|nr:hypothetical protein OWV82_010657 [Melia azedarach]
MIIELMRFWVFYESVLSVDELKILKTSAPVIIAFDDVLIGELPKRINIHSQEAMAADQVKPEKGKRKAGVSVDTSSAKQSGYEHMMPIIEADKTDKLTAKDAYTATSDLAKVTFSSFSFSSHNLIHITLEEAGVEPDNFDEDNTNSL